MKSNRDIIWDTIDYMKRKTINPSDPSLVDITENHWKNFTPQKREFFRSLLLVNKLISLDEINHWKFKLTAEAITGNKKDYNDKGILIKDKELRKQVKIALMVAVVSVTMGAILSPIPQIIQKVWPDKPTEKILFLPKIQIVRDTICLKK